MELNGEQLIPAPRPKVWAALNDPEILRQCIAGCESVTKLSDTDFEAAVQVKVGPVKARFKGKLRLGDLDPPRSYRIQFEGQGGPAGFGKGSADVRLEETGPDSTLLHYAAKAQVGGKIAQVGSRLVDMAAQKMAGEFLNAFTQELQIRYAPTPAAASVPAATAPQGTWARFMAWLRRLIRASTA